LRGRVKVVDQEPEESCGASAICGRELAYGTMHSVVHFFETFSYLLVTEVGGHNASGTPVVGVDDAFGVALAA